MRWTRKPNRSAPPSAVAGSVVEARGVAKAYQSGAGQVHALRGVDLRVGRGEMAAVVGPSGSGKTTLLNCLSGLDDVDAGEVVVAGEALHAMSDRRRTAFRGRWMGFIFQAFNLVPVFSAAENVELPLLLNGAKADEARRRAEQVLALVGLDGRAATTAPPSCRVASSSGSPSPGLSRPSRSSSGATNLPATSTVSPPSGSWICSASSTARA